LRIDLAALRLDRTEVASLRPANMVEHNDEIAFGNHRRYRPPAAAAFPTGTQLPVAPACPMTPAAAEKVASRAQSRCHSLITPIQVIGVAPA
jgi:hypothetical protein